MKKQLLIAAVAATMTSVAMADVSISGAAEVNWTNTDTQNADSVNAISHDFDLKITGKSGATTIVMDIENTNAAGDLSQVTAAEAAALGDATLEGTANATALTSAQTAALNEIASNELNVKNVYMKTNIAGVNVQMGTWYGADSLMANGSQKTDQVSLDYSMNGVKVQYENEAAGDESVTVSGTVSGVSLSHEMFQNDNTETKVSGSLSGVNVAYVTVDSDTTNSKKDSLEVSTEVQGVTLTYASVDVDGTGTTSSDTFFGTHAAIHEATGFGASMALAGNTVTVKSYDIEASGAAGAADDSYTKLVVNRPLASGATLEVTYTDKDDAGSVDVETLDIELAVKF